MSVPRVTSGEFQKAYGYHRKLINTHTVAGNLKPAGERYVKGRIVNEYDLIDTLEFALAGSDKNSDKDLMRAHLERLKAGLPLDSTDSTTTAPQQAPQAPQAQQAQQAVVVEEAPLSGDGVFSLEMLEAIDKTTIPVALQAKAGEVQKVAKVVSEIHQGNVKQLKALTDAGRLVDVKEIEDLCRLYFEAWVDELDSLPELAAKVSTGCGIPQSKSQEVLKMVRERLLEVTEQVNHRLVTESAGFMRMKSKEAARK